MTKLENAERLLALLKTILKDTPLWAEMSVNHSEELGPPMPLCDTVGKAEAPEESWNWFFKKFWCRSEQDRHPRPSPYFVARCDSPAWLRLTTYNRLAFSEAVPNIASALEGECLGLAVDNSWTWDDSAPRANGRPTHRTSYELLIRLDETTKFKSGPWLKTALANVCASRDPRADEYTFDYEEDMLGSQHCCLTEATRKGLILGFPTQAQAEKVVKALYADCAPKFEKNPQNGNVEVMLTLPA